MDTLDDFSSDVDQSMRMFERSRVGEASAIAPIRPSRVMLVLDGSNQDAASIAAAATLREAFNVETIVLDAQGQDAHERGAHDQAAAGPSRAASHAAGQISGARAVARPTGEAFEAILAALQTHRVDLVIVPCPFGRSFEQIGIDSVGTVTDVLLGRCQTPMLIVRRDDQRLQSCRSRVAMLIASECDTATRAAGWCFGLVADRGEVSLHVIVEKEHYENLRSVLEAARPGETFDQSQVTEALTQSHAQLHGAMAQSTRPGVTYAFRPSAGVSSPPNPLRSEVQQLLVMPLEVDDSAGRGFVTERIRRSPPPRPGRPGARKRVELSKLRGVFALLDSPSRARPESTTRRVVRRRVVRRF